MFWLGLGIGIVVGAVLAALAVIGVGLRESGKLDEKLPHMTRFGPADDA